MLDKHACYAIKRTLLPATRADGSVYKIQTCLHCVKL